jgi:CHASE3 domain sensor protein
MRLRIPPFLPPYAVLLLVVTYAIGALWLGLVRVEAITRLSDASSQNTETVRSLKDLLAAVTDIETAGRGYALTADDTYLEPFERARRRVPQLLSGLRDKMRDDRVELGLIEDLVSLIAERTTITVAGVERKRAAPDKPYELTFGRRGKETTDEIRTIIATLESREQDELSQIRAELARTLDAARGDLYVAAGVTLLLVACVFFAVRRLRSFMPPPPVSAPGRGDDVVAPVSSMAGGVQLDARLRDALLRARLAGAGLPASSGAAEHQRSLVAALEQALAAHADVQESDPGHPEQPSVAQALAALAQAYSAPGGVTIRMTIDRTIRVADPQKAFLTLRCAEWALEAITRRKRAGDVTLSFTGGGDGASLRILALTDTSGAPVPLTPREAEEANALRQGVAAVAGAFAADEGPTGFSLTLTMPAG